MAEINYTGNMRSKDAPVIRKLGVVGKGCEMTPFVWKGRLMRVEVDNVRVDPDKLIFKGHFQIRDVYTHECYPPFGHNTHFCSAYCENDRVYVFGSTERPDGTWGGDSIVMYQSDDLVNWQQQTVITQPGWTFWNTSVCKGPDGYVMAIEVGEPKALVGKAFTTFFATSGNLTDWTLMTPYETYRYSPDRYTACPALRYCDDYYYMICLEELPLTRYEPYIYRTKDFIDWEIGLHNPILFCSPEDRRPKPGLSFTPEFLQDMRTRLNINNCDVDLCEFCGYTYILYDTGDQLTFGCLCEAIYDGPLEQFLKAFFE